MDLPHTAVILLICSMGLMCLFQTSGAQSFPIDGDRAQIPSTLPALITDLARAVAQQVQNTGETETLDTLSKLQIAAGEYSSAARNLVKLRRIHTNAHLPKAAANDAIQELYARTKYGKATSTPDLQSAARRAFSEVFQPLSDPISAFAIRNLEQSYPELQQSVDADIKALKGKRAVRQAEALKLILDYELEAVFRELSSVVTPLIAEEDDRRYLFQKHLPIQTPSGAIIDTTVIRPKNAKRLPALLNFTIYNDSDTFGVARLSATHGYVGVAGLTRGKGVSPDKIEPYLHDGEDASALIDWIARQPWSDGRVGMFGGSYNGFTTWATAKHKPRALKAIMAGSPAAPGIDVPMEGNVVWNFIYPWPFYTTNNKTLDDTVYAQYSRWRKLNSDWYKSGRPYQDLDKIDGTPNPIFQEWISHPTYDSYWQGMIPFQEEFASISIPALTTAGYYYGGPGAAYYYFSQMEKYGRNARNYLLIGPYDHIEAIYGTTLLLGQPIDEISGYQRDPVARIDFEMLRFQWFDYVLKHGPKPRLLKDKVNYQVTGANAWKHAPSVQAMANRSVRYYLSDAGQGEQSRLETSLPQTKGVTRMTVDLANRSDVDRAAAGGGVLDEALDTENTLVFVSDPLGSATEISGLLSGHLDFLTNKKDFDVSITLYEKRPDAKHFQIGEFWSRASSMEDITQRRLLVPGQRMQLNFQGIRLMSHLCRQGSRLEIAVRIIKEPGRQINLGSGKPVIEEGIADAGDPLQIRWFNRSYVDIPMMTSLP